MKGIQKIEAEREARRQLQKEAKEAKAQRKEVNEKMGRNNTDVEFDIMIE